MPASVGTAPCGRRSHAARSATRPSARAADSGIGERRHARCAAQRRGCPFGGHDDGEHRLVGGGVCGRVDDRAGDLVRGRADRRHEQDDAGVDVRVGQHVRQHRRVRVGGRAIRACRRGSRRSPRAGRTPLRAATVSSPSARKLEAGSLAGVGAEDARDRRRSSRSPTQRPSSRPPAENSDGDVDQLLERLRADDAGLAEQRIRRPHPSRRARPCASSLRAGRSASVPLLSARIGLRRATRRAIRPNLRGFPNDST